MEVTERFQTAKVTLRSLKVIGTSAIQ